MSRRARENCEHLVSVGIVRGSACRLQPSGAQIGGPLTCLRKIIDMQIEVDLLLLVTGRPLRRYMIRCQLDPDNPLAIDDDAVPIIVAMHGSIEHAGPELTLCIDVARVEHDDPPNDLHARILPAIGQDFARSSWNVGSRVVLRQVPADRLLPEPCTASGFGYAISQVSPLCETDSAGRCSGKRLIAPSS